ncbi:MAG: BatD family protein [Planctomycetes bacterium]|nr:BatD family protein [Planctomycetota bacterium]
MRRLLFLLPILCAIAPAAADGDPDPPRHATLDVHASPAECWVGQPFAVRIGIGLDRDFLERQAVPLFSRPVDLPVRVEAPWLSGIPDTILLPGSAIPGAIFPTIALNDRIVAVDDEGVRDALPRPWSVVAIVRWYLPLVPGEIRLAAPVLRYAFATRFAEDFLDDRRPLDRQEGRITGEEVVVRVSPLPEAGRPPDFGGAVGRYEVRAEVEPLEGVEASSGPTLRVRFRIEGHGNLAFFDPPRLDPLADFHVYGLLDDRGSPIRTVTYDVSPLRAGVRTLPSIPFSFFDPGPPAAYRTIRTDPVSLDPAGAAENQDPTGPDSPSSLGRAGPPVALLLGAGALLVVAAAVTVLLHRRSRGRPGPAERRILAAGEAFRERVSRPGADLPEAFTAFLAARLGCTEAQVVAPDLRARLLAAGLPAGEVEETAALLDRLVASRYGGAPPTPADLETAFRLSVPARR